MAKYVSLEELQKFPQRFVFDEENASADFIEGTNTVIKYAENLESVEIVRCKDCRSFMRHPREEDEMCCGEWPFLPIVNPNDFCSDGKRRKL